MKFTLEIELSDNEIETYGIDLILPDYLRTVTEKCENGHADAGIVRHPNGHKIGQWKTTDNDGGMSLESWRNLS